MKDVIYNNADSFSMSFDQEWQRLECNDLKVKIDKIMDLLADHPFMVSDPKNARKIAEFRIFTLKKFK